MNPNVYSLWSQTPLSLGYITKACSLIGQFTCTLQKLCLEMAFFKNFKYVFWRLQTRCLKFENCYEITGLILLKWDTVQHDPSLGEKAEFPLVTDLWPRWPNKHVVPGELYVQSPYGTKAPKKLFGLNAVWRWRGHQRAIPCNAMHF